MNSSALFVPEVVETLQPVQQRAIIYYVDFSKSRLPQARQTTEIKRSVGNPLISEVTNWQHYFPLLSIERTIEFIENNLPQLELPAGSTWLTFPCWERVASRYEVAVEKMLRAVGLKFDGKFVNHRSGKLGAQHLRATERTTALYAKVRQQQPGDVLVVPAWLGYHNEPVDSILGKLTEDEAGFDLFTAGAMLMNHYELRERSFHLNCLGNQYAEQGNFDRTPYFHHNQGTLKIGACPTNLSTNISCSGTWRLFQGQQG